MTLLILLVAFGASLLTFFSGFGLGTLLLPVFALFFPAEIAVALTGVVHLLNNLFKLALIGRHAHRATVIRFGLPAIVGAIAGAWLLSLLADLSPWAEWHWGDRTLLIYPHKVLIGSLMIFFALIEIVPRWKDWQFDQRPVLGGAASGFFGGLSGHQGALRSAFLIRFGLSKEAFIATGVVIACFVDVGRLAVYFSRFQGLRWDTGGPILVYATLAAFAGALVGRQLLRKLTLGIIQWTVAIGIILLGLTLLVGLL
ncbi:MAG: sulfite exporter TauE/SafE family protein [Lewinella sp.]|nr:sulfite exporter TauE/SafE family protein [Lewinella sp.]